jgi:hypothetical protein
MSGAVSLQQPEARLPEARIAELPAFIDCTLPELMTRGHVPGAAVVIVHRGRTTAVMQLVDEESSICTATSAAICPTFHCATASPLTSC